MAWVGGVFRPHAATVPDLHHHLNLPWIVSRLRAVWTRSALAGYDFPRFPTSAWQPTRHESNPECSAKDGEFRCAPRPTLGCNPTPMRARKGGNLTNGKCRHLSRFGTGHDNPFVHNRFLCLVPTS